MKKLSAIFLSIFLISYAQATGQSSRRNDAKDYIWARYFNNGNGIKSINTEEDTRFYRGELILREGSQYKLVGSAGNTIVPYGKYLYETKAEREKNSKPAYHSHYGMIVRDPETGLYGMIDTNYPEEELVPCKYTSLTYFYHYIDAAIGTREDENGVLQKFFILMTGELHTEIPYRNKAYINPDKPYRFIRLPEMDKGLYQYYDIWSDSVFLKTSWQAQYYGNNLYRIDSSFNGLNKFAFIDHSGKIAVPFQINYNLRMTHFQESGNHALGNVSVLQGNDNAHYKYGLMDTTGKIYSMLREGEGYNSISLVDDEILGGNLLVSAAKGNDYSIIASEHLWDVRGSNSLTDIRVLFYKGLQDWIEYMQEKPSFGYRKRNEEFILFSLSARFVPDERIKLMLPGVSAYIPGGFGATGKAASYTTRGYGLMDYEGKVTVLPFFKTLEMPDMVSRLAYAELEYNDKIYKGFVSIDTGMFEFLFND